MATAVEHVAAAEHNAEACKHMAQLKGQHDWVTTIAFYQALHVVEALLANCGKHGSYHDGRASVLRSDRRFEKIWACYSELQRLATIARYLHDSGTPFSAIMDAKQVETHVINHLLHQVIVSCAKQMSAALLARVNNTDHFKKLTVN